MKSLVSSLIRGGILKTPEIIEAFLRVDRKNFVLPEYEKEAAGDYPLPIGSNQTISQPTTVAFMLELLRPGKGEKILDVGSGSGWITALLAEIVGKKGKVFGTEIIPELAAFGKKNLAKYAYPQAKIMPAGQKLGYSRKAPYDKILVSAAARSLPEELVRQLKVGGIMVIPINQSVCKIQKKSGDELETREFPGFAFVPLRERE